MTDELEQTRSVERQVPPPLVEPPKPERADATAPVSVQPPAVQPPAAPPAPAAAPRAPEPPEQRGPYRLRMADGVIVDLDLTVYLGRRPSVPRVASDRRVRLVAVPSAQREVSATHLELRMTGDAVVATDMRSTNGTIVTVPGSAPRTLLRGESAVLTPGALVDLGDGNVLELLTRMRIEAEV